MSFSSKGIENIEIHRLKNRKKTQFAKIKGNKTKEKNQHAN